MKKLAILAALALGLTAVQTAEAQRNERRRDRRVRPEPLPAPDAPIIRGFQPKNGAVGTTVTIRGKSFPDNAKVQLGRYRIQPTSVTDESITFVIPTMKDGSEKLSVRVGRNLYDVGRFAVGAGGADEEYPEPRGDKPHRGPRGDRGDRGDGRHRGRRGKDADEAYPDGDGKPDRVRARPGRRPDPRRGRPVVSSYWPNKGDPGTLVTIHGLNFDDDTKVIFGDQEVAPKQVRPREITFVVPRGRKDAGIALRSPRARRDVVVGQFEVVKYDFKAERRRRAKERRKAAETRWKQRRARLAADRAARYEAMKQREAELAASRAKRRAERAERLRAAFERAFLADPQTQAELALHAERVARLERMRRLAEVDDLGNLVIRIEIALDKENARHERRMEALKAAFKVN